MRKYSEESFSFTPKEYSNFIQIDKERQKKENEKNEKMKLSKFSPFKYKARKRISIQFNSNRKNYTENNTNRKTNFFDAQSQFTSRYIKKLPENLKILNKNFNDFYSKRDGVCPLSNLELNVNTFIHLIPIESCFLECK